MNRVLTWINLLGVLAVAGICGRQWTENARARDAVTRLDATRLSLQAKAADLSNDVASQQHDLDTLRGQLTTSDAELAATKQKLIAAAADRDRLHDDADKARASLDQWKTAVADRDQSLKNATGQVQTLVAARDDAVKRYNDLVTRFNQQTSK